MIHIYDLYNRNPCTHLHIIINYFPDPLQLVQDFGTDIGVHGGNSGFSRFGEVLHNPIVRSMNIQNTTVAPGGSLDVDVVILNHRQLIFSLKTE